MIVEMNIHSMAALRVLPPGTRLYLVRTIDGACPPSARTVITIDERDVVLRADDGRITYLSFIPGMKIEATESGFLVRQSLVHDVRGKIVAQYVVELAQLQHAS